ncbi:MAG: D-alanyl-D-alanine carboxypeptidase/D-alanyl-D-alanine-endopeptidase [Myxococcota bacterium]
MNHGALRIDNAMMMHGLTTISLCTLLCAGVNAHEGMENCQASQEVLANLIDSPPLARAKVGFYVENLDTGAVIFERDADASLIPASNIKLITTAAALHHLGPDYRFITELLGEVDSEGVIKGDLYIRGNGDPWLVPERLWYLAMRLYYSGVVEIQGSIVVDDSYFAGSRIQVGSEQDRTSFAYMAPAGAVSVGLNAILVHIYPGATPGTRAKVLVEPMSDYTKINARAVTVGHGRTRLNVDVQGNGRHDIVHVTGQIALDDEGRGYWRRIENPPHFAGEVLRDMLARTGIKLSSKAVTTRTAPEGLPTIASLNSPPLSDLVARVNKHSNNFMAHQLALAMAAKVDGPPGTWKNARNIISDFLRDEVKLSTNFMIRNASGLHDVNRVSTKQLVKLMAYMYHRPRLLPEYLASMAVAGSSGTLSGRMQEGQATGVVRGKTGTLSIASALSAYVATQSGDTLAFSFIVNNYRTRIDDIWALQDEISQVLATYDAKCSRSGPFKHQTDPFLGPVGKTF